MSRVASNSQEFPLFSQNRYSPPENQSPKRQGQGKLCLPDCSSGVSKEFPTNMSTKYQLKSRISIDNPYIEEDFREKFITQVKQQNLNGQGSMTARNRYNNSTSAFDKDFKKENILKNTDRILLRNLDKITITNPLTQTQMVPESNLERQGQQDDRIQMSVDLKSNFVDFKLEENHKADKRNYIKLPQLPIRQYDCIRDKELVVKPPDLELEGFSKFREKYYNIMNNQNKPFNKKLGLFTLFADRTTPERIMNKIYDQLKTVDPNTYKAIKKIALQHNIDLQSQDQQSKRAQNELDQSIATSVQTRSMKGSNSMKVLARGKANYRYYNNGQFIEKKSTDLDVDSVNQLTLSVKLQNKQAFPSDDFDNGIQFIQQKTNDSPSIYQPLDNTAPVSTTSTMLRTKSLGNIFKGASLTSLHSQLRPSVVPADNDEYKMQMKLKFKKMHDNQLKLEALDSEIKEFERTLKFENIKYTNSPPLYSPVRKSLDKQKAVTQSTKFSFGDSLNQRMLKTETIEMSQDNFLRINTITENNDEENYEQD